MATDHNYADDRLYRILLPKCLLADLLDLPPDTEIVTVTDSVHDASVYHDSIGVLVKTPDAPAVGLNTPTLNVRPTYRLDVETADDENDAEQSVRVRSLSFVSWDNDPMFDWACRSRAKNWNAKPPDEPQDNDIYVSVSSALRSWSKMQGPFLYPALVSGQLERRLFSLLDADGWDAKRESHLSGFSDIWKFTRKVP